MKLKDLRNNVGLTQRELAKLIGVSISAIQSWEAGEKLPVLDKIAPLCLALNVKPNDLLKAFGHPYD